METYSKYFNLYSATFRNDKKVITKMKKIQRTDSPIIFM